MRNFIMWRRGSGLVSRVRPVFMGLWVLVGEKENRSSASLFLSIALSLVWCGGNRGPQLLIASFALLLARAYSEMKA